MKYQAICEAHQEGEVVMIEPPKEYTTNSHNVCKDYDTMEYYKMPKYVKFYVKVACFDGLWYNGVEVDLSTAGYGSPCMPLKGHGHATRQEAITAGLKSIIKYLKNELESNMVAYDRRDKDYEAEAYEAQCINAQCKALKKAIDYIEKEKLNNRQLELF